MNKSLKVVITDCDHLSIDIEREEISKINAELILAQCKTEDEVIEVCKDADGIINQYAPITKRVLESLKNCRIISRYGVGLDSIDAEAAEELGIVVSNVPDYCIDEVSDHALGLIFTCMRKIALASERVKKGDWDLNYVLPIHPLKGRVLGIGVGYGSHDCHGHSPMVR